MGYGSKRRAVTRVELSEAGYWAEVRPLTVAEQEQFARDAVRHGVGTLNDKGSLVGEGLTSLMLSYAIVAWNVDDAAGAVLPINRASVGRLFSEDVAAITAVIGNAPRTPREQMDFSVASPSGPPAEASLPGPDSTASGATASSGANSD